MPTSILLAVVGGVGAISAMLALRGVHICVFLWFFWGAGSSLKRCAHKPDHRCDDARPKAASLQMKSCSLDSMGIARVHLVLIVRILFGSVELPSGGHNQPRCLRATIIGSYWEEFAWAGDALAGPRMGLGPACACACLRCSMGIRPSAVPFPRLGALSASSPQGT